MPDKIIVHLWHDDAATDPSEDWGTWKVYSFSRRHRNFKHPDEFAENPEFAAKQVAGLAFPISYFQHGNCIWSLAGEGNPCSFDSVQRAGFIVWGGEDRDAPPSFEDREDDARDFLRRYTQWYNGEVYGYTVTRLQTCPTCGHAEERSSTALESVGGFFVDDFAQMIRDIELPEDADVTFTDDSNGHLATEAQQILAEKATR